MARDDSNTLVRFDESEIQSYLAESVKKAVRDVFEAVMEAEAQEMLQASLLGRLSLRHPIPPYRLRERLLVHRLNSSQCG